MFRILPKKWNIDRVITDMDYGLISEQVMKSRGITADIEMESFLNPSLDACHDPFLLNDMSVACDIILNAIKNRLKILIYGDYDVDGVTSTAMLMLFLAKAGADVSFLIPDRLTEGYGLSADNIPKILSINPHLVITVDNGISAIEEVRLLRENGLKVIVTDHHECKEILPQADAVINPKRSDNTYPFRSLAGAGVAIKLIHALSIKLGIGVSWKSYTDICALGTVGDMVPLVNENRAIVHAGLDLINNTEDSGIKALYNRAASTMQGSITAGTLSYMLAPLINAAGRMGDSARAVNLLIEDNAVNRKAFAEILFNENTKRKEIESEIFEEARKMACETDNSGLDDIILVYKDGWHPGVLGIVASRLTEAFGRSAIILSGDNGVYRGSARSGDSLSVLDALNFASPYIMQYGGHKRAAGLSVDRSKISEFCAAIREYARNHHNGNMPDIEINAELELPARMLNTDNVKSLSSLEPFGESNQQPCFVSRNMQVERIDELSGGKHTKVTLACNESCSLEAIAFGIRTDLLPFSEGENIDIAYSAKINDWKGRISIQAIISDWRISASKERDDMIQGYLTAENEYAADPKIFHINYQNNPTYANRLKLFPASSDFVPIYKYLRKCFGNETVLCDTVLLSDIINAKLQMNMSFFAINRILDVFAEAGLLQLQHMSVSRCMFRLTDTIDRVSLGISETYRMFITLKR